MIYALRVVLRIIGVMGSTACGKSLLCSILKKNFNCAVFDADKFVHKLYMRNLRITHQIKSFAPECILDGIINRGLLLKAILKDRSILQKLECIIHTEVKKGITKFLKENYIKKQKIALLDIPLLFEINAHRLCNFVICVNSSRSLVFQRKKLRGINKDKIFHTNKHKKPFTQGTRIFYLRSGIEKRNLYNQAVKLLVRLFARAG